MTKLGSSNLWRGKPRGVPRAGPVELDMASASRDAPLQVLTNQPLRSPDDYFARTRIARKATRASPVSAQTDHEDRPPEIDASAATCISKTIRTCAVSDFREAIQADASGCPRISGFRAPLPVRILRSRKAPPIRRRDCARSPRGAVPRSRARAERGRRAGRPCDGQSHNEGSAGLGHRRDARCHRLCRRSCRMSMRPSREFTDQPVVESGLRGGTQAARKSLPGCRDLWTEGRGR